jgi:hypothetical protein
MTQIRPPVTAGAVVFGETQDPAQKLVKILSSRRARKALDSSLRGLPSKARSTAIRRIGGIGGKLLDLDVKEILAEGWRKSAALAKAARQTALAPGHEIVVDINAYEITAEYHPSVDILINEASAGTVNFTLGLDVAIKALTAVIKDGRIVELHSGTCEITARIGIEDFGAARRTIELELAGFIPSGEGIPLLPGAHSASSPPFATGSR